MTGTEAIYARRAVRHYTDEPVSEATIRELLDAATNAPSANNEQAWAFVVIQDKALLNEISVRAKELMHTHPFPPELHLKLDNPNWSVFHNAGTLIIIYARPVGEHPDWDCCFAAENLLIAARDKGLGSCVIGFAWAALAQPDIRKKLGIPEGYHAVTPIVVGHVSSFPAPSRRDPAEILSWKVPTPV